MKRLMLFLLMTPLSMFAQKNKDQELTVPIDSSTNLVTYQGVVKVDGVSKDDLYTRSREWFAKTFVSAQDVLQMDDRQSGKIIGKGSSYGFYTVLMTPVTYYLKYTVSVTVKDGRYRYEISSFSMDAVSTSSVTGGSFPVEGYLSAYEAKRGALYKVSKRLIPHVSKTGTSLAESLQEALRQPAKGIKSKDEF
jgi:hypothetical protein